MMVPLNFMLPAWWYLKAVHYKSAPSSPALKAPLLGPVDSLDSSSGRDGGPRVTAVRFLVEDVASNYEDDEDGALADGLSEEERGGVDGPSPPPQGERYRALPRCLQPYGFHIAWALLVVVGAINLAAMGIAIDGVVNNGDGGGGNSSTTR